MMHKTLVCCIVLCLSLDLVHADCKTNFECTSNKVGVSEFCTQACAVRPICDDTSVDTECDNGELMHLYDNPKDFCNCCPPRCIKYKEEDDECEPVVSDKIPNEMCGPQLGNYLCTKIVFFIDFVI